MSVPRGGAVAAILERPVRVCCRVCQLTGAHRHPPAAGAQLAGVHNRIHHRGRPVAHTTEEPR